MTLQTDRAAAGATYASAVAAFRTAFIELAAYDVIVRGKVDPATPNFGSYPDVITLRHTEFAPDVAGDWASAVKARIAEITP
jgi:hypothetical protein